jgi:hypothetical protein
MTKRVLQDATLSFPKQVPEGLPLSDTETAEALAGSLEAQFQLVDYPSVTAGFEMVK